MEDWKSKLGTLIGTGGANTDEPKEKTDVPKNRRLGVVFSTNPDFGYSDGEEEEMETLPKAQQKLRVGMEKSGRGGKTVTLVRGFVGRDDDLQSLGRMLKQRCGVGGSVKDGEIIIQGDIRHKVVEILKKEGYSQTK